MLQQGNPMGQAFLNINSESVLNVIITRLTSSHK